MTGRITTISTTRISLNFLINEFHGFGVCKPRRLGPLVDGVHRIAQALITSRYWFGIVDEIVTMRLPLRAGPTAAEEAYTRYIERQINAHVTDYFKDGWQTVWVEIKSRRIESSWPQEYEWYVEFRVRKDRLE